VSANASYTFGKSIDNASAFGGGAAQDDRNLARNAGFRASTGVTA
jgi:hypothetical protein